VLAPGAPRRLTALLLDHTVRDLCLEFRAPVAQLRRAMAKVNVEQLDDGA
jgi:hypothetical protein